MHGLSYLSGNNHKTNENITAVHSSVEKRMLRSKVGGCAGQVFLDVCWAGGIGCVLNYMYTLLSKGGISAWVWWSPLFMSPLIASVLHIPSMELSCSILLKISVVTIMILLILHL